MRKRIIDLEFDKLKGKIKARKAFVKFYRDFTKAHSLPPEKQYWTLCNKQSKEPGSEINQLVDSGLITPNQYYGIDLNEKNIKISKENHPTAHFYQGEWTDVITRKMHLFNPAIVYLDTTYVGTSKNAYRITQHTMRLCPPGALLFINVMLNNPHSGKDISVEDFPKNLGKSLSPAIAGLWDAGNGIYYEYTATGLTTMGTYIFRRIRR